MLLTELAMAGGALYYGAKAYHKRHRQKTCALFLQPTKAATTVHTVKGGESGKSALQDEALVLHLGATATPVASSDSGRLLALCQVLRREVTPWFSFPLYRTRADEAAQSQGRLSQSQSGSSWTFETVSLSTLKRSGTTRKDFADNVGKTVTVRACLAKNGVKNRAAAETIKLPDGQVHRIGQDVEGKFSDSPREY